MIRGIVVYALHGIEEHLRSWTFWLSVVALPAIITIAVLPDVLSSDGQTPLHVVAPSVELRALIEDAAADSEMDIALHKVAPADAKVVLHFDGDAPGDLKPRLVVAKGDAPRRENRRAKSLVRQIRKRALLTDAQRALLDAAGADDSDELDDAVLKSLMPAIVGLFTIFGLYAGFSSATSLTKSRDEEFFNVLRLGTPSAVIFLGGLLERAALGAIVWLPICVLVILTPILIVLGMAVLQPENAVDYLVWTPGLAAVGTLAGYLVAAGAGSVAGHLTRDSPVLKGTGQIAPLLLLFMMPAVFRISEYSITEPTFLLVIPALGPVIAAKGLVDGLPQVWIPIVGLLQLGWCLAALRLGAWAYGLEDGMFDDLRRRFRRAQ